jgi:hypothetical protein
VDHRRPGGLAFADFDLGIINPIELIFVIRLFSFRRPQCRTRARRGD